MILFCKWPGSTKDSFCLTASQLLTRFPNDKNKISFITGFLSQFQPEFSKCQYLQTFMEGRYSELGVVMGVGPEDPVMGDDTDNVSLDDSMEGNDPLRSL